MFISLLWPGKWNWKYCCEFLSDFTPRKGRDICTSISGLCCPLYWLLRKLTSCPNVKLAFPRWRSSVCVCAKYHCLKTWDGLLLEKNWHRDSVTLVFFLVTWPFNLPDNGMCWRPVREGVEYRSGEGEAWPDRWGNTGVKCPQGGHGPESVMV